MRHRAIAVNDAGYAWILRLLCFHDDVSEERIDKQPHACRFTLTKRIAGRFDWSNWVLNRVIDSIAITPLGPPWRRINACINYKLLVSRLGGLVFHPLSDFPEQKAAS
jgi:hypothetical protein